MRGVKEKGGFVYMMSNWTGEVLYTGVTNNLERRVSEHKTGQGSIFSKKYNLKKLVYYEQFGDIETAIARETEVKKWRREKKNELINSVNPAWNDLSKAWYADSSSRGLLGMTEEKWV